MVAITSIENFKEHKTSGKLGAQESAILEFVDRHQWRDWTHSELAQATGFPLSSVCGRVNTLVRDRLVNAMPKRVCRITGKTVSAIKSTFIYESEAVCH